MVIQVPKWMIFGSLGTVMWFPFILVANSLSRQSQKLIVNHERIHQSQQIECLVIPFYIIYLYHYFKGLIKFKNHNDAYMNIPFEREAYKYEGNFTYLKNRKPYAWVKD